MKGKVFRAAKDVLAVMSALLNVREEVVMLVVMVGTSISYRLRRV